MIDVWCVQAYVFACEMRKSCKFVERATELLCETFPAWFPVSLVRRNHIRTNQATKGCGNILFAWCYNVPVGIGMYASVCVWKSERGSVWMSEQEDVHVFTDGSKPVWYRLKMWDLSRLLGENVSLAALEGQNCPQKLSKCNNLPLDIQGLPKYFFTSLQKCEEYFFSWVGLVFRIHNFTVLYI